MNSATATYPETLSNENTGREFLRSDLASTPEEARAELARRLTLPLEDVAPIEGLVKLVQDDRQAFQQGYVEFYRPVNAGESAQAEYWQTEAL